MYLGYQNGKKKFYTETLLDKDLYRLDKIEETDDLYVLADDEYVLTTDIKALNQAKKTKTMENDTKRDEAINGGVIYKDVLFDSDTDQKVNLLATVSAMDDMQTIVWYGMDNQPLTCSKEDLINIGGLITNLHSFCWNKNAEIKNQIAEAQSLEDVEAIEINYVQEDVEAIEINYVQEDNEVNLNDD